MRPSLDIANLHMTGYVAVSGLVALPRQPGEGRVHMMVAGTEWVRDAAAIPQPHDWMREAGS